MSDLPKFERPVLKEFFEYRPELRHDAAESAALASLFCDSIAMRVKSDANRRSKDRTADVVGQATDTNRNPSPNRQVEDLLGDLGHSFEDGAATSQHDS